VFTRFRAEAGAADAIAESVAKMRVTARLDAAVVVIDLDNTLVRLEVDWGRMRDELARLARDAGLEVADPRIGALMQGAPGPGSDALRQAMEQALTEAEVAGAGGPRNEALVDWLDGPAAGTPISILSLNSRVAVACALELSALDRRVSHIVGREDVEHGKPDPEGMHLLAQWHGIAVERMLFIGDADSDRLCAERADARFMHVDEIGRRWTPGA